MQVRQEIIECLGTEPDMPCRVITVSKRLRNHRNKKKARCQKSNSWWSLSSMWVLPTASSFQRAWWSIRKSSRRSYGVCFTQCASRDESCGRTDRSCFTTTMHLLTTAGGNVNSWSRRIPQSSKYLYFYRILLRRTFSFPQVRGRH